jgi:hypothetical protein
LNPNHAEALGLSGTDVSLRSETGQKLDVKPPVETATPGRRLAAPPATKPGVEEVPWADGKRTLTKAYMLFLARWARRLSCKETAEAFRTSWDKVFDAVEHVVTFGLEHRAFGQIDALESTNFSTPKATST